jgi:hypothetical protein
MEDETMDDLIMAALAYKVMKWRKHRWKHSRNRKVFYNEVLSEFERQRRDRRIPRCALLSVNKSPWRKLLRSRSDQAMITFTGFDMESFESLLRIFAPEFDDYTPFTDKDGCIVTKKSKAGRPRKICACDGLGLYLNWTRTRGAASNNVQMTFGMTSTNIGLYLRFARRIIVKILRRHELAKIAIPTRQQLEEYRGAIAARHPALPDVWCTMDGLKLYLECVGTQIRGDNNNDDNASHTPFHHDQSEFYNGWQHDHYVTNVFCFCPDGTVPIACFNVPGCVHDSQVAWWGNIYDKLEIVWNSDGLKCVLDSAFGKVNREFLIKSSQDYMTADAGITEEQLMIENLHSKRAATSMRQSAEWGMRAFQASFPRVKDRFKYEETGERGLMLKSLLYLFNLRSRAVGINQIRNVYMPNLVRNGSEILIE